MLIGKNIFIILIFDFFENSLKLNLIMFKRCLFALTFLSLLPLKFSSPAIANDCGSTPEEIQTQLSFSCFGTISEDGHIPPDYNSDEIGYDISRQWQAGYHITQVLKLGDLAENFSPQTLTISSMISAGGGDITSVAIKEFPLIHQQSLFELIQAVPGLKKVKLKHFPGLDSYGGNQTLSQLLKQYPSLKSATLENLNIGDFALSAIPGLGQTQLDQFAGWGDQFLSNLPYFSTIPLSQMPNSWLANNPVIARIDALRTKEGQQYRTLSGSYQEGFNVPCYSDCDYVELDDLENVGAKVSLPAEGVRWISGKKQKVSGGEGCWAWLNNGQEPTGIHPFGPAFKVVLWDVNPQTEEVTTKLFFRLKMSCGLFGGVGASPYFIGPVSWMTHKTNDFIVAGFQGQSFSSGSVSNTVPNTIPNTTINNGNEDGVTNQPTQNNQVTANGDQLSTSNEFSNGPVESTSQTPIYTDINLNPINGDLTWSFWQFSQVLPAQPFTTTSTYLCHNDECGYSLGMYGLNSNDPFVIAGIETNSGKAWLEQINNGVTPTIAQIKEFFPKPLQQEILEAKLYAIASRVETEIDPLTASPFEGRRKVQRVAQVYYGGEASLVDADIPVGITGDPLLQASRNLVSIYQSRGDKI